MLDFGVYARVRRCPVLPSRMLGLMFGMLLPACTTLSLLNLGGNLLAAQVASLCSYGFATQSPVLAYAMLL